jgi:hypothetical protein
VQLAVILIYPFILIRVTKDTDLSRYGKYMVLMRKLFFAMSLFLWKAGLSLFILELLLKSVCHSFVYVAYLFNSPLKLMNLLKFVCCRSHTNRGNTKFNKNGAPLKLWWASINVCFVALTCWINCTPSVPKCKGLKVWSKSNFFNFDQ